jgi:hypothetical protein
MDVPIRSREFVMTSVPEFDVLASESEAKKGGKK